LFSGFLFWSHSRLSHVPLKNTFENISEAVIYGLHAVLSQTKHRQNSRRMYKVVVLPTDCLLSKPQNVQACRQEETSSRKTAPEYIASGLDKILKCRALRLGTPTGQD